MKLHISLAKIVFVLFLTVMVIAFSAFSQNKKTDPNSFRKNQSLQGYDTSSTSKSDRINVDIDLNTLDDAVKQVDVEMKQLEVQMKDLDKQIQIKNFESEIKKIDFDKMLEKIDEAIKKVEWESINKDLAKNIEKSEVLRIDEIRKNLNAAKKDLEWQKDNLKVEVPKIDADKIKAEANKAITEAKRSLVKTKEELSSTRELMRALQADQLIDKSKENKIEVKDGELYINGSKQPKKVNDKYKRFYKKDNISITTKGAERIRI